MPVAKSARPTASITGDRSGRRLRTRHTNGRQWLDALGNVPMERIVFDPPPGTATEHDLFKHMDGGGLLCELVDSTLVEKPVGLEESMIAAAILSALWSYVREHRLGIVAGADATLRMSKGNIREPDVSFVAASDLPGGKQPRQRAPKLCPTLAVEVISKGNTTAEMNLNLKEYFESGSKLAWFVYPKTKTVAVYDGPTKSPRNVLTTADFLDGDSVVPGFSMPVADVFDVSDFE